MLPSPSRGLLLRRLCTAFEARSVLEVGPLAVFDSYAVPPADISICWRVPGRSIPSFKDPLSGAM